MLKIRRRTLASTIWIPLRIREYIDQRGKYGHVGHREQLCGVATLAVPLERRSEAEALDWTSLGTNSHGGLPEGDSYVPCDVRPDVAGLYLALERRGNSIEAAEWHLHQDFVITLGLKREGDAWVSLAEGYVTIACTAPGFLDTRLRYAAWRSSYCSRASLGVRYASFSRRQHGL